MSLLQVDHALSSLLWRSQAHPELQLWVAVFTKGISDYCRVVNDINPFSAHHFTQHETLKKQVIDWLETDDNYPGAFAWTCDLFDLDTERTRRLIKARSADIARMKET